MLGHVKSKNGSAVRKCMEMPHRLCSGYRIGDDCHAENFVGSCALLRLTSLAYFGGGLAKKGLGYFARYVPRLKVERYLLVLKSRDFQPAAHVL